jgi:acyl carrier protein
MSKPTLIQERISRLFLTALHVDVPSAHADLFETGVLDSLAFVELLLQLEQEFAVTATAEDLDIENFRSIARIAAFVRARTAGAPSGADQPPGVHVA